tara:strand:+ start:11270 stop:12802 length:1533 start_codon:yes stop_codon:yes gene_type:complete
MVQVNKIDSNITGLAFAEEAVLGSLPGENGNAGAPVWYSLAPNSYNDFGGEIITVAPNPINPSRQRRKGVTTDLNASGGINQNFTFSNFSNLMQGIMFADTREKGYEEPTAVTASVFEVASTTGFLVNSLIKGQGFTSAGNDALQLVTAVVADTSIAVGATVVDAAPVARSNIRNVGHQGSTADIDVDNSGTLPAVTSTLLDFTTLGLVPGQWVFVGGDSASNRFVTAANNGLKRIRSIAATRLEFDKSDAAFVTETGTGLDIRIFFGDVVRNETGALIKRRSYNVERLLGAPDDAAPAQIQTEVLVGAVPNEFTLNVPSADLLNADVTFVATDNAQRDASVGPKQTSVLAPFSAKEYNTSSDVSRIRLSVVSDTDPAPVPLFAFVTEATISLNNNVTPNKAVGVLGAFDVTAGTFTVSGNLTAYFSNVSAVLAVRNNSDVTLDIGFIRDNQGVIFDFPLISLGDGRLNVEVDQPITLPLATDMASGEDIDATLDHTMLVTYFNYLPNAA